MNLSDRIGKSVSRRVWSASAAYPGKPTGMGYSGRAIAERFGRAWPWSWGSGGSWFAVARVVAAMAFHVTRSPKGRIIPKTEAETRRWLGI